MAEMQDTPGDRDETGGAEPTEPFETCGPNSVQSTGERAKALGQWLRVAPDATAETDVLTDWLRDGCELGLHLLLVEPGGKVPVDMRSPKAKREADGAAKDAARTAGDPHWMKRKSLAGVYLATNDPDLLAEYIDKYRKVYGEGRAVNVGVAVGPSRLAVVDCDTAAQVTAARSRLVPRTAKLTVRSPGAQDPETGEWKHRDGGHFWFTLPDDIEPPRSGKVGAAGDLKAGPGKYVLIPPSVRSEGVYEADGPVRVWTPEIAAKVPAASAQAAENRTGTADAGTAASVDEWAAVTPWSELLERHGWAATSRPDGCGCATWTAPGVHATPKSATAHEAECALWESDSAPDNRPLHIWTDNPGKELEAVPVSTKGYRTVSKLQFVAAMKYEGDVGAAMASLGIEPETADGLGFGPEGTSADSELCVPPAFWDERPFLRHIRDAAWARDESPHGVLLAVLALLSAHLDPSVRVETGIKSPLPLNMFVGLVATSGEGKTTSFSFAKRLLRINLGAGMLGDIAPDEAPRHLGMGSGPGISEAYMGTVSVVDPVTGKDVKVRQQVRHKLFLHRDEGAEMLAEMQRASSSLGAALRSAWSGELEGQANAGKESFREVHQCVLGVLVGFQRDVLARVVSAEEIERGTPQRFLYGSVMDPYAPDLDAVPDDPGPLEVAGLPAGEVHLCDALKRRVRADSLARRRGELALSQLETQRPAMVARTAALLAIIDGRTLVTESDWSLAETLFTVSLAVQEDAIDWARERDAEKIEQRAQAARGAAVATAAAVDERDVLRKRVRERLLGHLAGAGGPVVWTGRKGLRKQKFNSETAPIADLVLNDLVEEEKVTFDGTKVALV